MTDHDVLVVGAGQAGLATGHALRGTGLRHLVLDAGDRVGGSWSHYYESLTLFSPARFSSLPGLPFAGDPRRYPAGPEVGAYLRSYAEHFAIPVRTGGFGNPYVRRCPGSRGTAAGSCASRRTDVRTASPVSLLDQGRYAAALAADGWPVHRRGLSMTVPGLGFVGVPGQTGLASATLRGVGPDARGVVRRLRRRLTSGAAAGPVRDAEAQLVGAGGPRVP